jgi:predicted RNase H-like HicB family nuclease
VQEALKMVKRYDVLLTRDEESGWYGVEVPDLPGCYSQGRTRDEALANIREAIALYVSDRQDVPQPSEHLLDSVEVSVA